MARIGQAFSPEFLSLLVQRGERQLDRNLQAAIADRQLKLQGAQIQADRDQFNIRAQQAASAQGDALDSEKARLEVMKEEGRNRRAEATNELKEALAQLQAKATAEKEERLSKSTEADVALKGAKVEALKVDTATAQAVQPEIVRTAKAKADLTEAQVESTVTKVAKLREEMADFSKNSAARSALLQRQIANYESLIEDRALAAKLKREATDFAKAMAVANRQEQRLKLQATFTKLATTFDAYNQSLDDRARQSPSAAAARALIMDIVEQLSAEAPDVLQAYKAQQGQQAGAQGPAAPAFQGAAQGGAGRGQSALDEAASVFGGR